MKRVLIRPLNDLTARELVEHLNKFHGFSLPVDRKDLDLNVYRQIHQDEHDDVCHKRHEGYVPHIHAEESK